MVEKMPEEPQPEPTPTSILAPRYRSVTIGAVALISLLAFEIMAVTTAMPTVADALDGLSLYAAAFGATVAAAIVGVVLSGEWADARGPSTALWRGVAAFVVGLIVAGAAPEMWVLIVGRTIQGLGAGLLTVAVYVIVGHVYPADLRPRVFAALSAAWVIPSIVGPAIAGLVVQHLSWRLVFLAVPVLVVPAVMFLRPGVASIEAGREATGGRALLGRSRRLHWAFGAALSAAGLHLAGQRGGVLGAVLLVVAGGAAVAFGRRLLPVGTLRLARGLPSVIALRGLAAGAFFGAEVFIPLLLSRRHGFSPAAAGLALTVGSLAWSLGSWFQGTPSMRKERTVLLRGGFALIALGVGSIALTLAPDFPVWLGISGWVFAGLGMGVAYPSLSVLTLELSPKDEQGANVSALHLSEHLFTTTVFAMSGALFVALSPRGGTGPYLAVLGVAAGIALLGALVAPRAGSEDTRVTSSA